MTVPGSPVRAIQELPASIAKIKIRIDPVAGSPPFTPQELTLVASGDLTTQVFDGVPAGKVRVTAEVISAAGDVLGKNGQEIDVVKDEISQVQIVVNLKDLVAAAKVIRSVRVSTDSVVLNTMPETGGAETDLVASASVTATVVTDQGDDPGSGVIWSTTDPVRVTVIDGVIRARRESLETYIKRVTELEEIGNSFHGVSQTFAIQAGREIRVIVRPDAVDDLAAIQLGKDIAKKIEDNLQYPGQIRVTVIRETRSVEYAK